MKHRWLAGLSAIPVALASTVAGLAVASAPAGAAPPAPVTKVFDACGSLATWSPPTGVDTFVVEVLGAQGGGGGNSRLGGKGGGLTATFTRVGPGAGDLQFTVGCRGQQASIAGGAGGESFLKGSGGHGGSGMSGPGIFGGGGGGGGTSSLVVGPDVAMAAGGGGGGGGGLVSSHPAAGAGGGGVGGFGSSQAGNAGFLLSVRDLLPPVLKPLGTLLNLVPLSAGATGGGACANPGSNGGGGSPGGTAGHSVGGDGGSQQAYGGGGGGGGWVVGGGGGGTSILGGGGGGGGCGALDQTAGPYELSNVVSSTGVKAGDGQVRISYTPPPPADTTPTVTSVSPSLGFPGDLVVVSGTNFLVPTCSLPIVVHFGSVNVLALTASSLTQVPELVPENTPGSTVDVTVTNSCGQTSAVNSPADHFTYDVHE